MNIFVLGENEADLGWVRREKRSVAALHEHFRNEIHPKSGHLQQNEKFYTCSKAFKATD